MTFAITPVAAKDGNGSAIAGGVDFIDTSGTGVGPWIITKSLIDPAGANVQYVLSNNAAKCDISSINGTDVSGSALPISASALPLPTGAATSTSQNTINTTLGAPMQQTGGTVSVLQSTSPWVDNISQVGGSAIALGGGQTPAVSIPTVEPDA